MDLGLTCLLSVPFFLNILKDLDFSRLQLKETTREEQRSSRANDVARRPATSREVPMEVFELLFSGFEVKDLINLKLVSRSFLLGVQFVSFFCTLAYHFNSKETKRMVNLLNLVKNQSRKRLKVIDISMTEASDKAVREVAEALDREDLEGLEIVKLAGSLVTDSISGHQSLMSLIEKSSNLQTFQLTVTSPSIERLPHFEKLIERPNLKNVALHIPFTNEPITHPFSEEWLSVCKHVTALKLTTIKRYQNRIGNLMLIDVLGITLLEQNHEILESIDFREIDISGDTNLQELSFPNLMSLRLTSSRRFRSPIKFDSLPSIKILSTSFNLPDNGTEKVSTFVDLNGLESLETLELECHHKMTEWKLREILLSCRNLSTLIIKAGSCLGSIPSNPLLPIQLQGIAEEDWEESGSFLCPGLEKLFLHRVEGDELLEVVECRKAALDWDCKSLKVIGSMKQALGPKFEGFGIELLSLKSLVDREVSPHFV